MIEAIKQLPTVHYSYGMKFNVKKLRIIEQNHVMSIHHKHFKLVDKIHQLKCMKEMTYNLIEENPISVYSQHPTSVNDKKK